MRIISGRLKGRDLGAVPEGVRPTTDRVRESLFAALGPIEGLSVLDLFAGTGALGLEAYSRGASRVVFVDQSRKVARILRRRIASLGLKDLPELQVMESPAERALKKLSEEEGQKFDLVFVDPPYAEKDREEVLVAIFAQDVLNPGATVVVEGPKGHPVPPLAGVRVSGERRYGATLLTWLEAASSTRT